MSPRPERVLFGAAYYHEYQPSPAAGDRPRPDGRRRASPSSGSGSRSGPPGSREDGVFDLDWLQPVLDGAHARGISVILGTPTYAAPPWLARRYPEIAGERPDRRARCRGAAGRRSTTPTRPSASTPSGSIRKIVARYADHPAVIGFQVDNEPGIMLFHNHGVFQRFVDELRHTYGTVETLNEAWGLVYWSHQLSTWADLWTPGRQLPAAVRPGLAAPSRPS